MYTLIDLATDLVWGPFATLGEARGIADDFASWEIMRDADEALVDWSR